MLRSLLFALSARAVLGDGLGPINVNVLADIIVGAESDVGACLAGQEVIGYCVDAIPNFTDDPAVTPCLCCYSTTNIAPVYGSCASYIKTSATARSSAYEVFTDVSKLCARQGVGLCTSTMTGPHATTLPGLGGPTATANATGTSRPPLPTVCSPLASIVTSCSKKIPGFSTVPDVEAASCYCFQSESYTTAFDTYARTCVSALKTDDPSRYSLLTPLTTFCAKYKALATPTTSPRTTSRPPTTTPPPQSTVTVDSQGRPVTTARPGMASPNAVAGPVAWIAGVFTLFLSILFWL